MNARSGNVRFNPAQQATIPEHPNLSTAAYVGSFDRQSHHRHSPSCASVGLVIWLIAAAAGPQTYSVFQNMLGSPGGVVVLFGITFAFFFHLCGGIRHLAWDSGYGFELQAIYATGWAVVAASVALTLAARIVALFVTW